MKRIFNILCTIAMAAAVVACEKGNAPDGACGFKSISFTKAVNTELTADIPGTIDGTTLTFVIPTETIGKTLIPTFTLTKHDEAFIGGEPAQSGVTPFEVAEGAQIEVVDEISNLSQTFTVCIKENDGVAELLSVAIVKDCDPAITEDIAADSIEANMVLRVPAAAFQKELTIKAVGGGNDVVKINGEVAEDGTAKVDTKFPVDIEVVDENAGVKQSYVLKVGKILDLIITPLATGYTEGDLGTMNMAIDPVNNIPYVTYVRKNTGDAKKGLSVAKFADGQFSLVGTGSVSVNTANDASAPVVFFDAAGTPYSLYLGGDVKNQNSLRKWNGSEWALVGNAGIQGVNVSATYGSPAPVFQPGDANPTIFFTGNTKSTPTYRNIGKSTLNGETWTTVAPSEFPTYGQPSGNAGMFYAGKVAYSGTTPYFVGAFNLCGFYVAEFPGSGACNIVVNNYIPEGETCGLPGNLGIDCDPDGVPYIFEAVWTANKMQIYKVVKEKSTVVEYGPGLPISISSTGSTEQSAVFAINPVSGLFVAAVEEGTTAKSLKFKYLDESLAWNEANYSFTVGNEKAYIKEIAFDFANNGVGYLAVRIANNSGGDGVVGIHLLSIKLEDDILPE